MAESSRKITKRAVDAAMPAAVRYIIWDSDLKGFGLRVEISGTKTYIVRYRPRGVAAKRFFTIGRHGILAPEQARDRAKEVLGAVANGEDPAKDHETSKKRPSVQMVFDEFYRLHVTIKLKPVTRKMYRSVFDNYVLPSWGGRVAEDLSRTDLSRFHAKHADRPATANRVLNYLSSMYAWAGDHNMVKSGTNPAMGIGRLEEIKRERFLTVAELDALGAAIKEAETTGIPWEPDPDKNVKHAPKCDNRMVLVGHESAAAIRLLILTGARLREILHLRWREVDLERGLLLLPDSKTGKKTIILNAPAMVILNELPRLGGYVIAGRSVGTKDEKPRADLKRPWALISKRAGLEGVRLHDLRHTFASYGAGANLGLFVIGKLLGHSQASTTQRYAHLADDPLRRASESIGATISAALEGRAMRNKDLGTRE